MVKHFTADDFCLSLQSSSIKKKTVNRGVRCLRSRATQPHGLSTRGRGWQWYSLFLLRLIM